MRARLIVRSMLVAVVAAMSVCDRGDELSGPVEDARVVAGGEVAPEPQLAGLAVGGADEIQRVVDLAHVSESFR